MRNKKLAVAAIGLAALLLLSACGGSDAAENDSLTAAATQEMTTAAHLDGTADPTETVAAHQDATATPTAVPTSVATATPTPVASEQPTAQPTEAATEEPTAIPTEAPVATATAAPTTTATPLAAAPPTATPTEEPPEELFDGSTAAQYYQSKCAACHGANREGGVGPGLTPDLLLESDAFYVDTILNGRPGTAMPAWGSIDVSPAEAQALVTFFRTAP